MTELQSILFILGFIFLSNVIGLGIVAGKLDALITALQQLELDILKGGARSEKGKEKNNE